MQRHRQALCFDHGANVAGGIIRRDTEPAKAWPRFAQALLMTNEFLFVD